MNSQQRLLQLVKAFWSIAGAAKGGESAIGATQNETATLMVPEKVLDRIIEMAEEAKRGRS